jgi:hypothetical protein
MHADLHAVLRGCSTAFLRDVYAQFGRRQRRAYTESQKKIKKPAHTCDDTGDLGHNDPFYDQQV